MGKFITHDAIASGVLNRDYNSATSTQTAWQAELLNSPPVLELLLDRMGADWSSLRPKMRKPYTAKDVDAWFCWFLLSKLSSVMDGCPNSKSRQYRTPQLRRHFSGYVQCFTGAGSSLLQSVQRTSLPRKQLKSKRRALPIQKELAPSTTIMLTH